MPLTAQQRRVLRLLRANRTADSWISGSTVLHGLISRQIGDIDIHHAGRDEMMRAVQTDTAVLEAEGFGVFPINEGEREIEFRFGSPNGDVYINWVSSSGALLLRIERCDLLGCHASIYDAIYQKMLMASDGVSEKHFDDLAECANAGLLPKELLLLASRTQRLLAQSDFLNTVERGVRSSSLLRCRHLYSSCPIELRTSVDNRDA